MWEFAAVVHNLELPHDFVNLNEMETTLLKGIHNVGGGNPVCK